MSKKERRASVSRKTKETDINISINLGGSGNAKIDTGIGFFDHMLESFAKHSAIDLEVKTIGDLHIDMHHTIEDTGIVLGQAIQKALGDFKGIVRFGHAYIPMDEAMSRSAIDFCNRPYLIWKVMFERDKVGDVDTELFKEFFHALAMNSGACLHIENLYGENTHHIIESSFKAVARAMRVGWSEDPVFAGKAASTKGSL